MTDDEKANEISKLIANFLNAVAVAILAAGVFVPSAQFIFGILPSGTDDGLVVGLSMVCIAVAAIIHLTG
jgi:hypothetical protein